LMDFVKRLYSNDSETNVISTVETTINNQQALFVTTESTYGIGQFYLFIVNADMYLLFSSSPEAFENRDVQAILNSIAVSPEVSVNMPGIFPNSLPKGLNAACLGETTENPQFTETLEETNQLLCKQITPVELGIVACNIQDGIISRNTAPLLSYMTDPFSIGYWGSEWRDDTPRSILEEVQMYRLPSDGSLPLTFTVDRSTFPPLAGQNVDAMFGPDINIAMVIYSEGWGTDGKGAALIFITQDVTGAYVWSGLLVSFTHFDKISTGTTACGPASYEFLDYGVQIVEESLQTKDISIIEYWNVIPNPFLISYWGVEATNKTPQEVITEFNSILLPIKTRELSFLSSPGDFPPLSGHAPETLLGENITLARIIYSEGWGSDGNGAALLFFAQDECGGYYWHGIVFSPVHFDK